MKPDKRVVTLDELQRNIDSLNFDIFVQYKCLSVQVKELQTRIDNLNKELKEKE